VNPTQPRARRRLPFGNRAELQLAALGAKKNSRDCPVGPARELHPNPSIPHPTQPTTPSRARFESSRNFLLLFFQSYCCYPERNFFGCFLFNRTATASMEDTAVEEAAVVHGAAEFAPALVGAHPQGHSVAVAVGPELRVFDTK
jgi:hypothetical protein